MASRISGQAAYCLERAVDCREVASKAVSRAARAELLDMEARWLQLVQSFLLAEEISGYIQWQAQRVEPPPGVDVP